MMRNRVKRFIDDAPAVASATNPCYRRRNFLSAKIFFDRPLSEAQAGQRQENIVRHPFMMSPKFSLQKPYVVASLPNPIDHSNGRYVVGDVYGGAPGSKKRKRSELVVGVDGEGVNLYDVRF